MGQPLSGSGNDGMGNKCGHFNISDTETIMAVGTLIGMIGQHIGFGSVVMVTSSQTCLSHLVFQLTKCVNKNEGAGKPIPTFISICFGNVVTIPTFLWLLILCKGVGVQ